MHDTLIKETIAALLDHLGFGHTNIEVRDDAAEKLTRVDIDSVDASRIIGWHGETLNALQSLVKSIVRTQAKLEKAPFILLDVDGYRKMQEDKVRTAVERKADLVRRTGSRIALPPMSPYFRRIVHLHVAADPKLSDLTTESTGEGDYRQVVLRMKEEKKRDNDGEELAPVIEEAKPDDAWANLDV